MKKFPILIAVAVLALLTASYSCIKPENIVIQDVENFSMQGFSRADFTLRIQNKGRKASIESGKLFLTHNGNPMIDLMLRDRVEIPRRTTISIPVSVQLKIANPMAVVQLSRNPQSVLNATTVSGEMNVKAGLKKKIRFNNVPFPEFLHTLGVDTDKLIRSVQI